MRTVFTHSLLKRWGVAGVMSLLGLTAGLAQKNPVIPGLHADPEVMYSEQTGRYYLYPTTDNGEHWQGHEYTVYSSKNLKDWKDEGVILDLQRDVRWAEKRAWAPAVIEKKRPDGSFRYYFYHTTEVQIGVAVACSPTGPFVDLGQPLLDTHIPDGLKRGTNIDPAVFCDPQTGKNYLYWGNSFMAVAELNDDMMSFKPGTRQILVEDWKDYNEGTFVFYRKGWYYFLWSVNDTRSPDYQVRYVKARSPFGPINPAEAKVVVRQSPEDSIFATGHCSAVCKRGTDKWYLFYHRFRRPDAIKLGWKAGYNREACIDRLRFDSNGDIIEVKPTR